MSKLEIYMLRNYSVFFFYIYIYSSCTKIINYQRKTQEAPTSWLLTLGCGRVSPPHANCSRRCSYRDPKRNLKLICRLGQ